MNRYSSKSIDGINTGIKSKIIAVFISSSLLVIVGYIDYLTGIEISFSIFYLFPILIMAWYTSKTYGLLMAIIGATVWYINDAVHTPHYSHYLIPIWNAFVRLVFFSIITFFLCKLKSQLLKESLMARIDELTGLFNARAFYEYGQREVERAIRLGLPLSICYIDLDNFKQVNDTFGHSEGSKVIKTVGKLIQENIRPYDVASRLGGDEFAILFPQTNCNEVNSALSKLNEGVQKGLNQGGWGVTLSIGAVSYATPPREIQELIKKADSLMYNAKNKGKNQIELEDIE
ncbi:MAG: hypothetical protein Kow0090_21740 [Myxococcota bacterium]